MKYSKMIKFLNDNGILLMQPVIADTVDTLLPIGCNMSEEEFEEICDCVFNAYLDNADDPDVDIWYLADKELTERGYREVL
jgi:hypothetical protein